jgi:dihydrofolate reductase
MITSLIVAASRNDVIGRDGSLPWYLPGDLRRFRRLTTGHPVVVGRVTHESILARLGHPLPGRTSIVVSSGPPPAAADGVVWCSSLADALAIAEAAAAEVHPATCGGEIFVIGGASVYQQALPLADKIYLTRVHRDVDGDTSMPPGWLDGFGLALRDDQPGPDGDHSFLDYLREPS